MTNSYIYIKKIIHMDHLISLNEFLDNNIYDFEDKQLSEYLDHDFINEIYSSEFFNTEQVNESHVKLESEVVKEYRKIRKQLKEGKQYKRITKKFFELKKEYMRAALNEDKSYVKESTQLLTEKLNYLNEKDNNYTLIEIRKNKIKLLESYRRKTIRQINKEIKFMEEFYDSNPKILVTGA